ncbi:hypothetical protein D3C87_1295480 [compost metagenome]
MKMPPLPRHRHKRNFVRIENLQHLAIVPQALQQLAEGLAADGRGRTQNGVVVIDLVDALGHQQFIGDFFIAQEVVAQVGARDQGNVGPVA